jgi:REP element-mobilizing transposase RayT
MTLFQDRYRVESARLASWDYSAGGWYFVTICTKNKECCLGQILNDRIILSAAGLIAETEMKMLPSRYQNVTIDRYVVMPNHVHTVVVIDGDHAYSPVETRLAASPSQQHRPSLSEVVGSYKSGVSRICHAKGISDFAWQARFHDHILRCNASVNAVREYIDRNPENWLRDPERQG